MNAVTTEQIWQAHVAYISDTDERSEHSEHTRLGDAETWIAAHSPVEWGSGTVYEIERTTRRGGWTKDDVVTVRTYLPIDTYPGWTLDEALTAVEAGH